MMQRMFRNVAWVSFSVMIMLWTVWLVVTLESRLSG